MFAEKDLRSEREFVTGKRKITVIVTTCYMLYTKADETEARRVEGKLVKVNWI